MVLLENHLSRSGNPLPCFRLKPRLTLPIVADPIDTGHLEVPAALTEPPFLCPQLQEENERLQASLSQDQRTAAAQSQRQINALRAQLEEQARLIASQEEMVGLSLLPASLWCPLFCKDLLRFFWTHHHSSHQPSSLRREKSP